MVLWLLYYLSFKILSLLSFHFYLFVNTIYFEMNKVSYFKLMSSYLMNEYIYVNLMMYMLMYLISFHLVMNSDDWFLVWLGLEINMIMFIVLIFNYYDMMKSECCLKYFFIQSLGSSIFMSLLYVGVFNMKSLLGLIMSYKIGAGPFFFWFPSLCLGISWLSFFFLLTFQKIIPLILMNMFITKIMFLVVLLSLFLGIFGSFNQMSLKQLLAYSSIFHLGWIIMCNMTGDLWWLIYMLLYMLMLFSLVYFLNYYNMEFILETVKLKSKIMFVLLMLSMAGMPPLLGFFIKWFALYIMFDLSYYITLILIISSVVMFYVYFRLLYDCLLAGFIEGVWMGWTWKFNNKGIWGDMVSIMGMILSFFLVMMFF